MDNDTTWIMCAPPGMARVPGSIDAACHQCGSVVTVAPTGQETMKTKGALPVCITCGTDVLRENPAQEIAPISMEQIAELIGSLHRN